MSSAVIVLEMVLAVGLVMALGALLRRRGIVSEEAARAMGRVVADVAFPALCLEGLSGAEPATLRAGAPVVALGFVTLALATLVGLGLVRAMGVSERARPTVVFAIAIGNWIFLPLPVAHALFGEAGTTAVVLNNVGAQVFLWTVGIVILKRGAFDAGAARAIVTSPGLWATLLGIGIALSGVTANEGNAPVVNVVAAALHSVASLTIPLVCLAIGAQLAAPRTADVDGSALAAIAVGRLLLAPAVVVVCLELACRAGLPLDAASRTTEHLIAAMPVSLSAAALVEKYEGDAALVARGILVTTSIAVVSAPAWIYVISELT